MNRHRLPVQVALLCCLMAATGAWVHRFYVSPPALISTPRSADLELYFYPTARFMHAELSSGRLPLWSPHQFAGGPFLALHAPGLLYPPNSILLALLPAARALELHAILHLFVAGFFTWLFLARQGLPIVARATGALVFMFSEAMEQNVYITAYLSTVAWTPAILWAVHGLVSEARVRWSAALGVAVALAFLGGYAQGLVYQLQFAACYALFALCFSSGAGRGRAVALAGLAGAIAVGLCAAQLLPTLELIREGGRKLEGLSLAVITVYLYELAPESLLRGLLGGFGWGSPDPSFHTRGVVALPTIALLFLGGFDRERRACWVFFLGATLVAGMFMLGSATPVFRIYHELPLGDAFRLPQRMIFIYLFGLSLLSALGIAGVIALASRWPRIAPHAQLVAAAVAAVVVVDGYVKTDLRTAHPALREDAMLGDAAVVSALRDLAGLDRIYVEVSGKTRALPEKLGVTHGLYSVPDYEPMVPSAYHDYFRRDALWHGRLGEPFRRGLSLASIVVLNDLMSVRYYVLDPFLPAATIRGLSALTGAPAVPFGELLLIERQEAMPRAYAVFVTVPSAGDAISFFTETRPRRNPQRVAAVPVGGPRLAASPERNEAQVDIRSYEPHRVVLDATCSAPCLLVLTDLDYPGWEAAVDDEAAPIHRTNFLFRGVELTPGTHRVAFSYAPPSFRAGALVSLVTAGGLLLGWLFSSLRAMHTTDRPKEL